MGRSEGIVKVWVLGESVVLGIDGVVQSRVRYMDLVGANPEGSRVCFSEYKYTEMVIM